MEEVDDIERAVLRLAAYECAIAWMCRTGWSFNEAIEIAKRFGSSSTATPM